MKTLIFSLAIHFCGIAFGQSYSTSLDTFYVPTPEYSVTVGIDSLHMPCAITTPDIGTNFPVLILVHGTAALDMDANSSKDFLDSVGATYRKAETRMFYEIADSLSRNGIVVLRYDKRSFTLNCIEKPACWYVDTISPYDYIQDIHHAIDFIKTIPEVDTCNIFIAGHSQGGSFVTKVGYDRSDVRGVLDMAGLAQPIDSIVAYQTEFIDNDPVGANIMRQQFDSLRNGTWPMTDTLYKSHFSPRFWLDWISHSDSAVWVQENSDKPTALMYGTADRFVPSNVHYQIWLDSLTRPNLTYALFDSMDHSFNVEYDSTVSPIVLNFMTNWIHSTSQNCGPTDINDLESSSFELYPNPANDYIQIRAEGLSLNSKYIIWDYNGREQKSGRIHNNPYTQIDISDLSKGMYIISVDNVTRRFVKLN